MAFNTDTFEFLTDDIGTGTDAEMLVLWRAHLAAIPLLGVEREIRGKKVKLPDADKTLDIIRQLEARINADAGQSKINYARRQRAL